MLAHSGPFSYSPGLRGFSTEDFTLQKRSFSPDDHRESPPQRHSMSRPNGRSIYIQRKEYSETLNRQSDNIHVRVEHLFTCELDGQEVKTLDDCLAKLKRLDVKGRLWPQEMIMEIQGGYLVLSDIETKVELESHALSSILQTKAVLDSCAYDSVLAITLRERSRRFPQIYLFQCEETGAEHIKSDLDKVVKYESDNMEPYKDQPEIRVNLENIIGQNALGNFRSRPVQRTPSPMYNQSDYLDPPTFYASGSMHYSDDETQINEEIPPLPERKEKVRKKNIFNHILDDLEIFMDKVTAATSASQKQSSNKMLKTKKSKKNATTLPSQEEYVSCLQKMKYGFNLLAHLQGTLTNPSAEDFVHIFFSILDNIISKYPSDVPSTVVSPLLTVGALRLLNQAVDQKEDQLWRSLGDSWNLSRSGWPDDVPPYIPEFYNGWQPPPPSLTPSPVSDGSVSLSRNNSQRFPLGRSFSAEASIVLALRGIPPLGETLEGLCGLGNVTRASIDKVPVTNGSWGSPSPTREPPEYMRVIYDFMARNNKELSIMRGEVVRVIQKSRQWWYVRNDRYEEGNVPHNVLEPMSRSGSMEDLPRNSGSPVTLDMSSSPAEVRAWLEYKGFSRITVSSLGVLNGRQLLGMTKDQLRTASPEDGAKVAFQLQAVKSAIALNSESSGLYNRRY